MTLSITEVFRKQAQSRGLRPAIHFNGGFTTYAALDRRANRVANALRRAGVKQGDRVAILAKNSDRFFEVLGGVAKLRACLAPINFRLAAPEIEFILSDMAPRVLFVGSAFLEKACQNLTRAADGPLMIGLDDEEYVRWRESESAVDPGLTAQPTDDVLLLYTSGTTGRPKGVRIIQRNYAAMLAAFPDVPGFSYREDEVVSSAMPLFHIAGINVGLAALSQGCTVIPMGDFEPPAFLHSIGKQRINHAFLAPSMIASLLQAQSIAKPDFSSLRTIAYGAAPISGDVLQRAQQRFGCEFVQLYGMTESTGAGTFLSNEAHALADKQGSCGVPWPGMRMKVIDTDGRTLPAQSLGEICMQSEFVTPGYRNREDATAEAIRDGWLLTGDAGYFDQDGFLFIQDRMKDMIISGGENVFPTEVENAIAGCPGIADVAVIGVPSDAWGEEVKAIVVIEEGANVDPARIIEWTKSRIASFKVPKSVDFTDALPRNAAGKILKRELRAPYWKGRSRQVN
jgi:acyl-CoA synthetase (AMP-forming)/AMP-acid ligase II